MQAVLRLGAIAVIGASLVFASGCGGGSSSQKTAVPTINQTTKPVGNVTPFPTPLITGNQLSSPTKGYSATFPEGWHVRPNLVQTSDASVDGIFEPLIAGKNVQANIAINCIVLKAADPNQWIESMKTNTARQGLNKDIQVSQRQIAGLRATVLSYRFESQQGQTPVAGAGGTPQPSTPFLDKRDYSFSNSKCDWTITTTTLAGEMDKYQPQFDILLNSFKLIS